MSWPEYLPDDLDHRDEAPDYPDPADFWTPDDDAREAQEVALDEAYEAATTPGAPGNPRKSPVTRAFAGRTA